MAMTPLIERITQAPGSLRVDREKGVIYGARLLGEKSANGRHYGHDVRAKHRHIYERAPVFLEHENEKGHLVVDHVGWSDSIDVRADATFGNVNLLLTHPQTPVLLERAERNPESFGLSHEVHGDGKTNADGTFVVERMEGPARLAFVTNPATNKSLFESRTLPVMTLQKLFERALGGTTERKLRGRLLAFMEDDSAPVDMAMAVDPAPEASDSAEDQLKAGFRAAINKVLDDESLDRKAKLAKVKQIMDAEEKLLNDEPAASTESGTGSSEGEAKGGEAKESRTTDASELARLREEKAARVLCESLKFTPTELQLEAIVGVPAARRKALIESFRATATVRPPRSGIVIAEQKINPADDLAALRG